MYLQRHSAESADIIDVHNSQSFCHFGDKFLSKPGDRSGIEKRTFSDVKPETVACRRNQVNYNFFMNLT
jgi:hypothetical protein